VLERDAGTGVPAPPRARVERDDLAVVEVVAPEVGVRQRHQLRGPRAVASEHRAAAPGPVAGVGALVARRADARRGGRVEAHRVGATDAVDGAGVAERRPRQCPRPRRHVEAVQPEVPVGVQREAPPDAGTGAEVGGHEARVVAGEEPAERVQRGVAGEVVDLALVGHVVVVGVGPVDAGDVVVVVEEGQHGVVAEAQAVVAGGEQPAPAAAGDQVPGRREPLRGE